MSDIKVPFIDLKQRYDEEKTELLACVERVVSQGHFVLTQEVSEFEEAAAKYVGMKHIIGLNSGTDALMMALWATGIGKGDEVITTPVSFVATTGSIVRWRLSSGRGPGRSARAGPRTSGCESGC